jgi:hypothetical protein
MMKRTALIAGIVTIVKWRIVLKLIPTPVLRSGFELQQLINSIIL